MEEDQSTDVSMDFGWGITDYGIGLYLFSHVFVMSADIMSSLCGVYVHVCVSNFSSKTTRPRYMLFFMSADSQSADIMSSLCSVGVRVRVNNFFSKTTRPRDMLFFMSSLCGVGVRVNNFSSKTTRPRDVLFFLKDTLSIEDEKLFKACKSVCSSVC